jgi:uncharacterized short protein YbdD (DUF466 family)
MLWNQLRDNAQTAGRYLGQTLRLMVGIPDYDGYVAHMKATHPDKPVMTYEEFFIERQNARYCPGSNPGMIRCC